MKIIETEFIHDENKDHQANRDTNSKTKNIDHWKNLVLTKITPRDSEIIFDHNLLFKQFYFLEPGIITAI